jgi:hypothetical protein
MNPNDFSNNIGGVEVSLPIAVWVIVPMFILMMASLFHMIYYSTKNFFKFKKWERDTDNLNSALYWSILHEPKPHKYNLQKFKETASVLQVSNITTNGTVEGVSPKLQGALNIITELEKGECIDFRDKRLGNALSPSNPLVIKNHLNCLAKDANFIEEVLQNREKYDTAVFEKALKLFVKRTTFPKAKKHINVFTRESFIKLVNRVSRDSDLGLTTAILNEFVNNLHESLKCSDFLLIANVTKKQLTPDENLKLFRDYQSRHQRAETAYLYLLFDYEMIDKAGEYLDEHDPHDFIRFRALYDLKKTHTKYKITDLINIKHICNDA